MELTKLTRGAYRSLVSRISSSVHSPTKQVVELLEANIFLDQHDLPQSEEQDPPDQVQTLGLHNQTHNLFKPGRNIAFSSKHPFSCMERADRLPFP